MAASCKLPDKQPVGTDGGSVDGRVVDADLFGPDAAIDAVPDAAIDAPPDADPTIPDTTPPSLLAMTPGDGASVWLHAPVRLVFDEDLASASATATVSVGGAAVSAQVELEAPRTLVVTIDASARGVGPVAVHVDATVRDAAGNMAQPAVDATFNAPAWHGVAVDRGVVANAPALAVDRDGNVIAAWQIGSVGARRLVVSRLVGSTWSALGGSLGAADVTSRAIAVDSAGSIFVAWSESGVAHVAQWTGSAWTELASPGSGDAVAIAAPPTGNVIVAVFGAVIGARELVGGAWQVMGADITPVAACVGELRLAVPAASAPVIGWIDSGNQLRVYRFGSDWTAMAPIGVSSGSTMSLAARGSTIAIAWDTQGSSSAASFGVLAAVASGGATSFTQLGKPLDIDIAGDARGPAVALDASGRAVVAWTELVETAYRGAVATWSGSAWTITGGVTWLSSASARPDGAQLVLAPGGVPVVATSAGGGIHVTRLNGPRTAALGIAARASIAGCGFDPYAPPALLSQTGCFSLATANRPVAHAGLVPFDVVVELWSDAAKKRRWIGLPDGGSMTLGSNGSWVAPTGTIIVKEFAIETTPGNPATRRVVETRFLINDPTSGWLGFSYRWNTAGTDASLLADAVYNIDWPMDNGTQHTHQYPSRQHCRSCHYVAQGPLLGLRPEQLARWNDYDGVIADQLATLANLGVGPATTPPALTSPHDPSATDEKRMRGYMHANCAHCHNPQYLAIKDLRFATPLASTKLCESITAGSPATSVVYQKVTSRPGMPPLGTLAVDPLARDLLGGWITGMTSCP